MDNIDEIMAKVPDMNQALDSASYRGEDEVKLLSEVAEARLAVSPAHHFSTGFNVFDEAMKGGMRDGNLIIISGVSGQGKTTFAQNVTYHLCKKGMKVLWFSYEVSVEDLHMKFVEMGISQDQYKVYIPQKNTSGHLDWLRSRVQEAIMKHGVKFVFVDHLDFLEQPTDSRRVGQDNQAIIFKRICTALKAMAIELNIVVIAMAHMGKKPDAYEPGMQDIGYSAGIFQLADYVFIVHRAKKKIQDGEDEDVMMDIYQPWTKVKLEKNRLTGMTRGQKFHFQNNLLIPITTHYGEPTDERHARGGN